MDVPIEKARDRDDEFRVRRGVVRFVTISDHRFVMVDGSGPAGPESFEPRMPGLYTTAYGLRFALKRRGIERKVGPLEGLWWQADGSKDLDVILSEDRGAWRWTLMIAIPDEATEDEIEAHLEAARAKLRPDIATSLRVERFDEGTVAQVLHVGPYAQERPSLERLHEAISEAGFRPRDRHHEIYLGNPQRTAPERLRTILRHPIER